MITASCGYKNQLIIVPLFVPYLSFLEITDLWPCFEFHENSVFEILPFWKKMSTCLYGLSFIENSLLAFS